MYQFLGLHLTGRFLSIWFSFFGHFLYQYNNSYLESKRERANPVMFEGRFVLSQHILLSKKLLARKDLPT